MNSLLVSLLICSSLNMAKQATGNKLQSGMTNDISPTAIVVNNISEICKLFDIPAVNCSCSLFSMNGTDKNQFPDLCAYQKYVPTILNYSATLSRTYATITVLSSIIGIIGNIAVILVAYKNRKNLPTCKWLIAFLAASDLLFAIQQFILVIPLFWTNVWLYGEFMCKFLQSGTVLGSLVSISLILTIALERYIGILYPLRKRDIGNMVFVFTGGLIILSIAAALPLFVVYKVNPNTDHCGEAWPRKRKDGIIYDWFIIISYFLLPVLLIAFLYVRIILHLNNQPESKFILNDNDKERRWRDNKRVMRILLTILIAFIACVFPNRFAWLYFNITNYKISETAYMVLSYFALLPYPIHVACNPIIYSLVDKTWRKEILLVFGIRKRQARYSRSSATSNTTVRTNASRSSDTNVHTYGSVYAPYRNNKESNGRSSIDHTVNLLKHDRNELLQTEIKDPVSDDVFN